MHPLQGQISSQYAAGRDLLVSIEGDTLTFNDVHGQKTQVPILRQETLPDPGPPSWSDLANIDYFSTRLDRLTEILALSPDQQAKVKPILEQESGELAQVRNNPAISKKDKLDRLQSVVLNSDRKNETHPLGCPVAETAGCPQRTEAGTREICKTTITNDVDVARLGVRFSSSGNTRLAAQRLAALDRPCHFCQFLPHVRSSIFGRRQMIPDSPGFDPSEIERVTGKEE